MDNSTEIAQAAAVEQSEFGKGFLICLVKFAEHFMFDLHENETPEQRAKSLKIWGTEERLTSSRIQLWANGASDHLFEIVAPAGARWDSVRAKVAVLQEKGLRIGHGFTSETWTREDRAELVRLTREIALETDQILGVVAEEGKW